MALHGTAHLGAGLEHAFAAGLAVETRQARERNIAGVGREIFVAGILAQEADHGVAGLLAEHQQVGERIGAQTVGAVHRGAAAFAGRVEAWNRLVRIATRGHDDLAVIVGGDATHLVVAGGHDRDRFLDRVDVGELAGDFANARQTLFDHVDAEMVELEQDIVGVLAGAAAFLDLGGHGARYDVAAGEVFHVGRVALHEALAVFVEQITALAAHAFGDQHTGTGDTGGMELPELHVFERDAGAGRHAQAIAGVDEGVGRGRIDAAGAAGGEQGRAGMKQPDLAGLHFHGAHAQHLTAGVADDVECHPLDEEQRVGAHVALVERVQHRVAGTVGGAARALHRALAEVLRVPAERALVDGAVVVTVERHAEMLEFVNRLRSRAAHELDGVLVAEIVGTLDRVVHVPQPRVFAHVAERSADAALRGDRVRAGRKHLGQHRDLEAGLGELQ